MTTCLPQGSGTRWLIVTAAMLLGVTATTVVSAQDANWIWCADHEPGKAPIGACHFRKSVTIRSLESANLAVAADDSFEIRINGRSIGSGSGYRRLNEFDITRFLSRGRNVIAIRVVNSQGTTAGLVVRVQIKEERGGWQSHSTDSSWKTSLSPLPLWDTSIYNDCGGRPLGFWGVWERRRRGTASRRWPPRKRIGTSVSGSPRTSRFNDCSTIPKRAR